MPPPSTNSAACRTFIGTIPEGAALLFNSAAETNIAKQDLREKLELRKVVWLVVGASQ